MAQHRLFRICRLGLTSSITLVLTLALSENCALAQLNLVPDTSPDRSLGTRVESLNSRVDQIRGGTRRGNTLFHSFSEFNIPEGRSTYFENPTGVTNILSRVTGNDPSEILGTLGVGSPDVVGRANLFLINPNGILFGENASLDTRGSFLASTASGIQFDNWEFSATNPQSIPLLTVNVPIGLQFDRSPQSIINQAGRRDRDTREVVGGLRVRAGNTLALIGGDIRLDGGALIAPGGQIELGGVTEPGMIKVEVNDNRFGLRFPNQVARARVSITDGSIVTISGADGGNIAINAHDLHIGTSCLFTGSTGCINTSLNNQGGSITIISTGAVTITSLDPIGIFVTQVSAEGGIYIQAQSFALNGADLSTETDQENVENTTRNAGDITIRATDSANISVDGSISATSSGAGDGGNILIVTRRLRIDGNSDISTEAQASGDAGRLVIRATEVQVVGDGSDDDDNNNSELTARAREGSTGNAGNLTIETRRLSVQNGGIATTTTRGDGQAGALNVTADVIELEGDRSSLNSGAGPNGTGNAGSVTVTARELNISNGALIQVRGLGLTAAGNITITADSIRLNQGRLEATAGAGSGANISLIGLDQLLMSNGSQISAQASNDANGGNISIIANGSVSAVLDEDNDIIASADRGNGGNITIFARQGIFGLEERRAIPGNGTNDIDASSRSGSPGTVTTTVPQQTELPLAVRFDDEPIQGCQVAGRQSTAQFLNTGRGGLPLTPYEPFSSSDILDDVRLPEETSSSSDAADSSTLEPRPSEQLVEAHNWTVDEIGRVILIAATPDARSQSHCYLR